MSRYRRKQISKRRWLARWKLGRKIPAIAFMQHEDLERRMQPSIYLVNCDCLIRKAA